MRDSYQFEHVCPRHCFSNCGMTSFVENGQLVMLTGKKNHPYSRGKLCAKGYSYIERNYHHSRLKHPYYQEVKGSGQFKQITWRKAFEIISCEMLNIQEKYGHFLPLSLYKGAGNVGVHHSVAEQFFSSLGITTRMKGAHQATTGYEAMKFDMGAVKMANPTSIRNAKMIIIWGANPAATNTNMIPFIIEAKAKGAKLVVIDPIYSQTAELADLYIQLYPSTDGLLANLVAKELIAANHVDSDFIEHASFGYSEYAEAVLELNREESLQKCGVVADALQLLVEWIVEVPAIAHIIGTGMLKHSNGGQNFRAIEALAAIHGDIGIKGGGIFFRREKSLLFQNEKELESNRNIKFHETRLPSQLDIPIEMLWITCGNPLVEEPNSDHVKKVLNDIPFVVTVDLFMTPTAEMSNLVLPTTSHFEEMDIVTSYWHRELLLNERAVKPYYESLSGWKIMTELAKEMQETKAGTCSFPIYESEEEYLNAQFTKEIQEQLYVKNISTLKERKAFANIERAVWEKRKFATTSGRFEFSSAEALLPLSKESPKPKKEHPFWLITPHTPFGFNSQFHFLNLSVEDEAVVEIHPKAAEKRGIFDSEIIKIFNDYGVLEIKAVYSQRVPNDILVIQQGWYPESEIIINQLVPPHPTDMGEHGIAFYDTFVNVGKL